MKNKTEMADHGIASPVDLFLNKKEAAEKLSAPRVIQKKGKTSARLITP